MSRLCLQTRQAAVATPIEEGVWLYAGSGVADFSRGKCKPHTPKKQPSANQLGFLSHCQATVCGLVRITVVLGSYIAALEKTEGHDT